MYGAGGHHGTWRDQPSIEVISDMVVAMSSVEEQLLHMVKLVLERHPAIVNARFHNDGASLIQFVVTQTNQPKLLHALLQADCELGLPADCAGRSALHAAIELGKWHSLQLLLDALRSSRFTAIPGAMAPISECFAHMAIRYPLDFLHFVANFELQPEPEVLGENDGSDVMIPHRIMRGSARRSPKGIWKAELAEVRARDFDDGDDGFDGANTSAHGGRRWPGWSSSTSAAVASASSPLDDAVELGYNQLRTSGVQAYRVPFENFAALPSAHGGVSAIQLIVHAVKRTHDYTVFGSTLVELLLEYKWQTCWWQKYLFDVAFHLIRVLVVLMWNQLSSRHVEDTFAELWDGAFVASESEFVLLAVLWVYTTVSISLQTRVEIIELRSSGFVRFFTDVWNVIDVTAIASQLAINALFVLRDHAPKLIRPSTTYDAGLYNSTLGSRRLFEDVADFSHALGADEYADGLDNHRMLRAAAGGTVLVAGGIVTGEKPTLYIVLQAVVSLLSFLRLLFYFKGVLRLGALVHTMT